MRGNRYVWQGLEKDVCAMAGAARAIQDNKLRNRYLMTTIISGIADNRKSIVRPVHSELLVPDSAGKGYLRDHTPEIRVENSLRSRLHADNP